MTSKNCREILVNIGVVVKEHRLRVNLSQFNLGLEIGKSANQIGRIERAESNPTIETLYALAQFFNIDIKDFF